MKTGFKETVKLTESKKMKDPWNFEQPAYDERTSCFINAGTYHGVGKKVPVGKESDSSPYAVPMGKVKTLDLYPDRKSMDEQ